ncbi:MAG TPA: membrane dipeptidase [Acidimicrobiales bacterium]|nr:membrane dipeptidase [Acidimicrobiales bacterium]
MSLPAVSSEALELLSASEVVDAHIESFVWSRVFGYDVNARHGRGPLGGWLFSQSDVPRMIEAGMTGGVFSIATNPFRRRRRRRDTLVRNVNRLRAALESSPRVAVVKGIGGYRQARADGKLACFLAVQGGNAIDGPDDLTSIPDDVISRITLVHLSRSPLGSSSAPGGWGPSGLTDLGRACVKAMNDRRIIVDLAHISRSGFWDALSVHDRSQPAIVSHTGVCAVHDSWRNVDDDQIKAIADTGGVVGIMFHTGFLGESLWAGRAEAVVRHVEHVIRVGGEGAVAIGSDWDGLIVPPVDLRTVSDFPLLVQLMLDRGLSPSTVQKALGANYLRVVEQVRPAL